LILGEAKLKILKSIFQSFLLSCSLKSKICSEEVYLQKCLNTPENIKISFFQSQNRQNPADFCETQSTVPLLRNGTKRSPQNFFASGRKIEKSSSCEDNKFVSLNSAPDKKLSQTFTIILPNLIHKSKKRNLKH
jgi:hypothetical protein